MVYILLPAYNEAGSLSNLLDSLGRVLAQEGREYRVVLVNDGSSDNTSELARSHAISGNVTVLEHDRNRGLAAALRTGFNHLRGITKDDDIVITMDADNTHPPEHIPGMLRLIEEGQDVVIASRYVRGARVSGLSTYRRLLSRIAGLMFRVLLPIPGARDYTCGYRAYRAGVLRSAMQRYGEGFVSESGFSCMVDVLLKLRPLKPRVSEVPLELRYERKVGQSKMKVMRTVLQTLWLIARRLFMLTGASGGSPCVQAGVIVVLVFIAYGNTLFNGFDFDTPSILIYNEAVHGLSLDNIRSIFLSVPNSVEYLPVRDLTYMLDHEIWDMRPMGYHISNIFYYAAACVFAYLFFARLLEGWSQRASFVALLTTVLFALHPLHVESVAGIAQRKDIVSGMFFFMSLWMYMCHRESGRRAWFLLSLAAFVLAMFSKATAVVLPVVIMLINAMHGEGRRRLQGAAGFMGVAALITVTFVLIARGAGLVMDTGLPLLMRLPTAARAVIYNIKMLILPYPLMIRHEFILSRGPWGLYEVFSYIALALIAAMIYSGWRTRRMAAFSALMSMSAMLPVIGLLPTSTVIAERYMFLPVAGLSLLLAWSAANAVDRRRAIIGIALLSLLTTAYFTLTLQRTFDWRTNETLLMADLRHNPGSYMINQSLGRYHFANRRYEKAFRFFGRLKEISPGDWEYEMHQAMYHYYNGEPMRAIETIKSAGLEGKGVSDVFVLEGMAYVSAGMPEEATTAFRRALEARKIIGLYFRGQAQRGLQDLAGKEGVQH